MIKDFIKLICKFSVVVKALLSSLICIFLLKNINFFSFFPFLVENGLDQDFGMTFYFVVSEFILNLISSKVKESFDNSLKIIFYPKGGNEILGYEPEIVLQGNQYKEIIMSVEVNGKYKTFKDKSICLKKIPGVTMQINHSAIATMNGNDIEINFNNILNQPNQNYGKQLVNIKLLQENDYECTNKLKPVIDEKLKFVDVVYNEASIKVKR